MSPISPASSGLGDDIDITLLDAARAGDHDALTRIIKTYQNAVYTHFFNHFKDAGLADDLTQQTFIKVCRALASFKGTSKLSTWIFTIARNVRIDHLRKIEPEKNTVSLDDDFRESAVSHVDLPDNAFTRPPDVALDAKEQRTLLRKGLKDALLKLSPDQREVLLYREVEEKSFKEIAEITGTDETTLRTRLHSARQKLRALLHAYAP